MKNVYYFTNIAPHYREEIWTKLVRCDQWDIKFIFGKSKVSNAIKGIDFKALEIENNETGAELCPAGCT